jgi:hypothetical protein
MVWGESVIFMRFQRGEKLARTSIMVATLSDPASHAADTAKVMERGSKPDRVSQVSTAALICWSLVTLGTTTWREDHSCGVVSAIFLQPEHT